MPAITASMVAELRAKTDAPMMECKKALTEAEGDMSRAEEILRVKLGSRTMQVKHKILEMHPGRRFVWCDTGWFTAVAFGQRARTLAPVGDAVHYRVELSVRGPLAWLARLIHGNALKAGLQAETAALKQQAEGKDC